MNNDTVYSEALRKNSLSLMAKAPAARVVELLDAVMARPAYSWLRVPEVGSVMVRGRAGGRGEPFNLGEMTITRCTLRLDNRDVVLSLIEQAKQRGTAIIGIFHDEAARSRVCDRQIDVTSFSAECTA